MHPNSSCIKYHAGIDTSSKAHCNFVCSDAEPTTPLTILGDSKLVAVPGNHEVENLGERIVVPRNVTVRSGFVLYNLSCVRDVRIAGVRFVDNGAGCLADEGSLTPSFFLLRETLVERRRGLYGIRSPMSSEGESILTVIWSGLLYLCDWLAILLIVCAFPLFQSVKWVFSRQIRWAAEKKVQLARNRELLENLRLY